ncbi:MAG: N-acetylmuramoyl-L-alanine amidase [Clostridiales bacterium]|nr:N-acetylmuramoyl-L-alanine amidase [Clostridiales bacterium]
MRTLLALILALCLLLPAAALSEVQGSVIPREAGFDYDFTLTQPWVRLQWKGPNEKGVKTLYAPDGHFTGSVDLRRGEGGKYTITVEDINLRQLFKQTVQLPAASSYVAPTGKANANVTQLQLGETTTGFTYSFLAPGTDYMLLYFRSVQEEACFPVYPINAEGRYEGEVVSDLTYARTLFKVQIRNGNGSVKREGEVRKAYIAPDEPEQLPGRLSGVVVCIDPGHQENHHAFTEDRGPGLSGRVVNKGGMAQGKTTLRRESIVVLETGMILRELLMKEGATVVMTRHKQDDFRTNLDRCNIAEEGGAHILLRLHCNMTSSDQKTGIQVYGPLNSDYAHAVASPAEYRALGQAFLDEMKKAVSYELTDKTGRVALNDTYVGNNWAKMLCFLVEMGYMSNTSEDIKLATPEYQTMLAQGMVEGVYQVALMRGWVAPDE